MKTLFIFISLFLLSSVIVFSQKGKSDSFEGTITYSVTTEGEFDANTKAQLPTEVVWTFKGPKSSMLMKTGFGNINIIADANTKEQVVLYDMMGQKMAIKSSKEETEKALNDLPDMKVEETGETKKIINYNCKKVKITDNENHSYEVYVTNEINIPNPNWNTQYKNINGVLMEYSQKANPEGDAKMIFTAKEVKKFKVKDNVFEIPSDYKQMTMTEFKQMFGGEE